MFSRFALDRQTARFAFREESLGGVEPREIVEQPGETGFARVEPVTLGEHVGAARNAHAMRVSMVLPDVFAYAFCQLRERHESTRVRSVRNRLR